MLPHYKAKKPEGNREKEARGPKKSGQREEQKNIPGLLILWVLGYDGPLRPDWEC
jgi:hypothetical protein